MDATSKEYFHTLEMLKQELSVFKSEQSKFRIQMSQLAAENKRLTGELKENVQMRLQHLTESDVGKLEQQLQSARDSKDAAMKMWQEAIKELEKKDELLLGKKSIVSMERNEVEKQIHQMKEEYYRSLNVLSEELSLNRTEIAKCKKALDERTLELEDCRKIIGNTTAQINANKTLISNLSSASKQLETQNQSLKSLLNDAEKVIEESKNEISSVKKENWELNMTVSELKDQNKKLKSKISTLEKDAKESLLAAEEAVLQKKEIAFREELCLKEIEQLKNATDLDVEKVSLRFKAEIKEVQKQASEKIKSLMDEIQNLHRENGEKQSMFEKSLREKQALESKMELLYSENAVNAPFSNSAFDDMLKRLTMAEKSRDEFELKASSLDLTLQELKHSKDMEMQYLQEELKNTKDRLNNLLKDFNLTSTDRMKLCEEIGKLKKKSSELEKELKMVKSRHSNELAVMSENFKRKHQNVVEQLNSTEEHYKKLCAEMQNLLDSEFKISNQLKAEADSLICQSENKIKELCQNIAFLKHQNTQLVNMLHENDVYVPQETVFVS
ncbi:sodium channel and clathrin linker 1-like [Uloborus diversus]|uniref:sodium channel and clathrin linker 1-like n=1 Tax=Uloborus diversus TaxID=327109 RepID=UPI00240A1E93|nr:sodium channel and clathrin linker 1-like [Uloborus diversus]